jgi:acyl-CoA reductase-like NAD-dependent aldehyde dehydrogenase
MMLASIADAGRTLLTRLEIAASRASSRTIAALPAKERRAFIESLKHLIAANEKRDQSTVNLKLP